MFEPASRHIKGAQGRGGESFGQSALHSGGCADGRGCAPSVGLPARLDQ